MDPVTYDALFCTIAKIQEHRDRRTDFRARPFPMVLCSLFYASQAQECSNCPIYSATGASRCRNDYVQQAAWASLVVYKWGNDPRLVDGALDRLLSFLRALVPAGGPDHDQEIFGPLCGENYSAKVLAQEYVRWRNIQWRIEQKRKPC